MQKEIEEIFYKNVIPEAANGVVVIDGWHFNIHFYLQIIKECQNDSNLPTEENNIKTVEYLPENQNIVLMIKDMISFNQNLTEYATLMLEFLEQNSKFHNIENLYFNGNRENILKGILAGVWINATEENFKNPEQFLRTRIDFLTQSLLQETQDYKTYSNKVPSLDNSIIETTIESQNPLALETPFVFKSSIRSSENALDVFNLPDISYGVSNHTCYIYTIQGKKEKANTSYQKKNQ